MKNELLLQCDTSHRLDVTWIDRVENRRENFLDVLGPRSFPCGAVMEMYAVAEDSRAFKETAG